jgi:hypothetical protein
MGITMNREINELIDKFVHETDMDDIEVEHIHDNIYICNDVRQLGYIDEVDGEYCIEIEDEFLKEKGNRFFKSGWKE